MLSKWKLVQLTPPKNYGNGCHQKILRTIWGRLSTVIKHMRNRKIRQQNYSFQIRPSRSIHKEKSCHNPSATPTYRTSTIKKHPPPLQTAWLHYLVKWRYTLTRDLYNTGNYDKMSSKLYTVLNTLLTRITRNYNIKPWSIHVNTLFGEFQSKIILFFLYHLCHNCQLFKHACHQLNHCMQDKKNEKSFCLASVHKLLDYSI